ncbi:MAG: bifunctional adenosylcobinamide kinase/adenosylcobinamide-phosphate guanylyltransferase [Acidobacteria bacterium]|nr:bifunctional adenosylcobinamide kinase/adenosylcobinamide-phosphate guanylyltransferase [Acidobacteriota bacterium]
MTLILGGARSGKSRLAQKLASRYPSVVFVATATPVDDEMRRKIERHKADRPPEWVTVEEPISVDVVVRNWAPRVGVMLVDCLTLYAANLLSAAHDNAEDALPRVQSLLEALGKAETSILLVSNDVGSGIVPAYPSGRAFRDLLGQINQQVAAIADNVAFMVAGLPLVVKGKLEAEL